MDRKKSSKLGNLVSAEQDQRRWNAENGMNDYISTETIKTSLKVTFRETLNSFFP